MSSPPVSSSITGSDNLLRPYLRLARLLPVLALPPVLAAVLFEVVDATLPALLVLVEDATLLPFTESRALFCTNVSMIIQHSRGSCNKSDSIPWQQQQQQQQR